MTLYHSLRSNCQCSQIRLCSILPASFGKPIQCHIEAFDFNSCLQFEALSYAWGDPTDQLPIEANGEKILVTRNLATALMYLRDKSDSRDIWVDAICINQNDIDERNAQVTMMGEIYRAASRVISWLGIRDPLFDPFIEMEYAMLLLRQVKTLKEHQPFQENLKSDGAQKRYSNLQDHNNAFNNGLYSLQLLIGEREKEKPAYWQRAWITQEVASAKTMILQSGSYTISEEDIELVREFIGSSKVALLMDGRYEQRKLRSHIQLDSFVPVSIYRNLLHSSPEDQRECTARIRGPLKLLVLLRHNRSRFCADMRDKVYSIISISDLARSSHPGLSINYERSVLEVYTGAVQAIIQSSSMLEVLCSTNLAETTSPPHLPSWVPNWSIYRSPDRCDRPISYKHQRATGITLASVRFWQEKTIYILSATGFCFGSILGLKDPFVHFDVNLAEENDALSRLTNYASLYRQLSQAYREMARILYPKPLLGDLFRHTCSLGLLRYDLDDSFQSLMENLELHLDSDQISERPMQFSGKRFRYKTMAFSINGQCMFAIQQNPLMESTRLSDCIIGIAPPGVVRNGDLVCLLLGCSAPLILRPVGNRYLVVCAAYVDTLMDGSAMEYLDGGLFRLATFDLE